MVIISYKLGDLLGWRMQHSKKPYPVPCERDAARKGAFVYLGSKDVLGPASISGLLSG